MGNSIKDPGWNGICQNTPELHTFATFAQNHTFAKINTAESVADEAVLLLPVNGIE